LDNIDRHTLKALQKDGRKKNYELAKETGLAPSTMLDRVKKLEDKGIIKGYRAVMEPEKAKMTLQKELDEAKTAIMDKIMQEEASSWHMGTNNQ